MKATIQLDWPPTVNTYYVPVMVKGKVRKVVSRKGRAFRKKVKDHVLVQRMPWFEDHRLKVLILAFPPDNRLRDLDNIQKPTFDALGMAGAYDDDSQIDDIRVIRQAPDKPGRIEVMIETI